MPSYDRNWTKWGKRNTREKEKIEKRKGNAAPGKPTPVPGDEGDSEEASRIVRKNALQRTGLRPLERQKEPVRVRSSES